MMCAFCMKKVSSMKALDKCVAKHLEQMAQEAK